MYQATQAIYEALSRCDGLKAFAAENAKFSAVWLSFRLEEGGSYRIHFISTDDDNDVTLRVYALLTLNEEQQVRVLPVLNDLNSRFRYAKFTCDQRGGVNVEYDYPLHDADPAASAEEMVRRFVNIIDKAYPVLIKTVKG